MYNYGFGQPHGRGFTVVGGKVVTFARNQTSHAHQAGIYINAETSYNTWDWEDIIVAENIIRESNRSYVDGIPDNEAGQAGLFISANPGSPSKSILATHNQIYNSHFRGVAIGGSCSKIVISDNLIDTCAATAMHLTSPTDVILSNNVIRNAGKYGLYVDAGSAGNLDVNNNLFVDVNAANTATYIDVILIRHPSSLTSLKITNNRYDNPSGYRIERLIENHLPAELSILRNNRTSTRASIWQKP